MGKDICPVPESCDYLLSWDSELKINPGPWVVTTLRMDQAQFPPQDLAKTNTSCSACAYFILMAATCPKGDGERKGNSQFGSKHPGKRLLICVHCPELPVSQEAEVEMFMDCFFFTLYHVWLPVQAKAAMENLHVLAIIRP